MEKESIMVRNKIRNIIFFVLTLFSTVPSIQAGAGKSFGLFAGGAAAGVIGTKLFSRKKREPQQAVVQERIVERPVYIQQPLPQAVASNSQETQQLKSQLNQQQQEIMDLKRQLREEHKEVESRARKRQKTTKAVNANEYRKEIFDDFDPQVES